MLRLANIAAIIAIIIAAALCAHGPARAANCEIVKATHSADTKGEALHMSRALAARSANELRRKKGWKSVRITAQKVQPDPFWKKVRPKVPKEVIYGTFTTARAYSICFTGVVVPYVCTSGSKVCGN